MLQLTKVDFYNPSVQFVCRFTDIYCGLIRKIIPATGRFDIASIFMAFTIQFISIYIIFTIFSSSMPAITQIAIWSLLVLAGLALRIYFIALILMVIFSWVRPQGSQALMDLSNQLIRPLLAPFHKFIPPLGGLDFFSYGIVLFNLSTTVCLAQLCHFYGSSFKNNLCRLNKY